MKTLKQIIEEEQKKFEKNFPIPIDYPPINERMEVFAQIEIDNRVKRASAKQEAILSFLSDSLTRVVFAMKEAMVVEEKKPDPGEEEEIGWDCDGYNAVYNSARTQANLQAEEFLK